MIKDLCKKVPQSVRKNKTSNHMLVTTNHHFLLEGRKRKWNEKKLKLSNLFYNIITAKIQLSASFSSTSSKENKTTCSLFSPFIVILSVYNDYYYGKWTNVSHFLYDAISHTICPPFTSTLNNSFLSTTIPQEMTTFV